MRRFRGKRGSTLSPATCDPTSRGTRRGGGRGWLTARAYTHWLSLSTAPTTTTFAKLANLSLSTSGETCARCAAASAPMALSVLASELLPTCRQDWLSLFSLGMSASPALSAAVKAAPVCSGLPAHNLPPARTRSIEVLTANKSTCTCSTSAPTSLVGCLVQLGVVRSRQTARQELQVRAEPPHPPSPHSLIDPGGTGCPP